MKKRLTLLKLHTKSAFITVPRILLGSVVITVLVIMLSFMISLASNKDGNMKKMTVAVVCAEGGIEEKYMDVAFGYLESADSINNVCNLVKTDKEEAFQGIRSGKYEAALVIPENFVYSLMYGDNTPIEAVFSSKGVNNSSMVFREMLSAGGSDVGSAESAIYAMEDLFITTLRRYKNTGYEYVNEVNAILFTYALNRSVYFTLQDLAVKDGLNTLQFYLCSSLIMLLILSGITSSSNLRSDSKALSMTLKTQRIHAIDTAICRVLGLTIVYFLIEIVVFGFALLLKLRIEILRDILTIDTVFQGIAAALGLFILTFSVFSFIYFIFKLVGNPVYSVLVLFLVGMVFMFASGLFVSSSLLPKAVRMIGSLLPTNFYGLLAGECVKGTVTLGACLVNILYASGFLGLGALIEKTRRY